MGSRTGKDRIEGVDYVRRGMDEPGAITRGSGWSIGGAGKSLTRSTRKPTDAELVATWEACERNWDAAIESVGRGWLRSSWGEGFSFRVAEAALAEIEARAAKSGPARKQTAKPRSRGSQAKPAAPKSRTRGSHRRDDLFRMYRAELEALGTPEALEELARRKAKREAKRAGRTADAHPLGNLPDRPDPDQALREGRKMAARVAA